MKNAGIAGCMGFVLEQTKQQQVLALGRLGWPVSRIAAAAQVDRGTLTRYLRGAGLPVRGRGRPSEATANAAISGDGVSTDPPANPAIWSGAVSTDSPPSRAPRSSACESHRDRIEAAVRLGRNAMAIWQDLVDEVGFNPRYASVRRFARHFRRTAPPDTTGRHPHHAWRGGAGRLRRGADGPSRGTGKYRRTRLFVLTLAHSRKAVRLLTWQSSAQTWAELHGRAFRRLAA